MHHRRRLSTILPRLLLPVASTHYEILAHEYVHLMIGEKTGLLSLVPVWLNEGLAVYAESQVSPDCRTYWNVTFDFSRARHKLLDWDEAALRSTGEFPADKARIHSRRLPREIRESIRAQLRPSC